MTTPKIIPCHKRPFVNPKAKCDDSWLARPCDVCSPEPTEKRYTEPLMDLIRCRPPTCKLHPILRISTTENTTSIIPRVKPDEEYIIRETIGIAIGSHNKRLLRTIYDNWNSFVSMVRRFLKENDVRKKRIHRSYTN